MNFIIAIVVCFFSFLISAEGFVAGTFVKTPTGYELIENLSVGDNVLCFDCQNRVVERPITYICKKRISSYVRIIIADESINSSPDQKFYNMFHKAWFSGRDIKIDDNFLTQNFEPCFTELVELKNESVDVYLLSIAEYHNFFVSRADVCVHNFIPAIVAGISFLFGSGIEIAGVSFGLASLGTYLGYQWHKNKQSNIEIGQVSFSGGMMPDGPEDEEEKKRKRDQAREEYKPLTNKEAREFAKEMGYRETKNHPCGDTRNKPVFFNGKNYISPDADGHRGGVWKKFNKRGQRLDTWNVNLTKIIGD